MGDKMIEGKKPRIRYKSKILREKGNKKEVDPKEHSSQDQGKNKKEKPVTAEHRKSEMNKERNKEHKTTHSYHESKKERKSEDAEQQISKSERRKSKKTKKTKLNVWAIVSLIELLILIFLLVYHPGAANSNSAGNRSLTGGIIGMDNNENINIGETNNNEKKAAVDFYVMAYCPFGNQAEEFIYDVYKSMKDAVTFNPRYVIYTDYAGGSEDFCIEDPADGKTYCSMHGIQELHQDIRELCVAKYFGMDEWFEFAIAMNDKCNSGNADTCWEGVAKDLSLDVGKIKSCEQEEGLDLVKEQYELDQEHQVSGSPTIFVNDELYTGSRSAASMMTVLCNLDSLKHSDACEDIPVCTSDSDCPTKEGKIAKCENPGTKEAKCVYTDDAKVELIVINDDECPICETSGVMMTNRRYFLNLEVREVEADTAEGKELIEKYGIEHLPAYIFSDSVTKTNAWQAQGVSRFFRQSKDKYLLTDKAIGSTWPADPQERQQYLDLLQNYAQRNLEVLNYGSGKPRLDYFVMSFCPYGNPAEEAAEKIYSLLGDKVEIVPHYILSTDGSSLSSLHGVQEANQDVRELCALDLFGLRKFFDFVLQVNKDCNSGNADTCWEDAAKNAGLRNDEISQIKNCFDTRKFEIAKQEADLNNELYTLYGGQLVHPSASPTFLINGETYSGSRDANEIKKELCALFNDNDKPTECSETIETTASSPSGTC